MSDHFPALCECHQVEFGVCVCGETLNFDGSCPNSGPPEREILQDLIAELRVFHHREGLLDYCQLCSDDEWVAKWPCDNAKALDRAEARLREATNE